VPAMLNLGLSGVPYVTHDIAGYSGGPSTKELWFRWTELGAFTPIMRTHEGLKALLNWRWNSDAETLTHFRHFANIHMALGPTFEALATEAAISSVPPIRHLVLEFPNDPEVVSISDEYMLGSDLLVAPVVEVGATSREVYFPAGTWFHALRADESYVGPGRFTVSAPLGMPPVFSRGAPRADLIAVP
jgi:alpha-glucosidase